MHPAAHRVLGIAALVALSACGGSSGQPDGGDVETDGGGPQLFGVDPSSVPAGSGDQHVVVFGGTFERTSVVRWNATPLTSFFLNETQLGAIIPASRLAAATRAFIDVATSGTPASNALEFTVFVQHAVPVLDSLTPDSAVTTDAPVTVHLAGSGFIPESKVLINGNIHPSQFVSSTELQMQLDSNDLYSGGTFTVWVTNPGPGGGTSGGLQFTVINPVPAITALDPPSALIHSNGFLVNVIGTGFVPSSRVTWNGQNVTAYFASSSMLEVSPPGVDTAGTFVLLVTNPPPGGGTSAPFFFTVDAGYPLIEVPRQAIDVAWDGMRKVLYASVPGDAPYGNSIQVIDPDGGTVIGARDSGVWPSSLALSDDGRFLYVGLGGDGAVQRFDLPSLTPSLQYEVGSDDFLGPYAPGDIQVAPGHPHTVAVTRVTGTSPQTTGGVVVFDDATARPVIAPPFGGTGYIYSSIQWSADGTHLYANNNESTGFEFLSLTVAADGLRIERVVSDSFPGFWGRIHYLPASGLLYGDDGVVLDPATAARVGTFFSPPQVGLMVPDSTLERAFFLLPAPSGQAGYVIQKYDLAQRTLLGSIDVPSVVGDATRFIRWGDRGLAIVTGRFTPDRHLYLLEGSFVDGSP